MEPKFLVSENMIMWAFRYALGRRTGAVTDVCDHLLVIWMDLRPFTRKQIKEEIKHHEAIYGTLGDQCDVESWKEILKLDD